MYELLLWIIIIFLLIMNIIYIININNLNDELDMSNRFIEDLVEENKILKKLNLKLLDIKEDTSEEDYLPFLEDVDNEL